MTLPCLSPYHLYSHSLLTGFLTSSFFYQTKP